MPWKGDITNRVPNPIQEPIDRSEKLRKVNRAEEVRRDTDTQKNFTISLEDVDETILKQLQTLQLQVTDAGKEAVKRESPKPPKLTRSQKRYRAFLKADTGESFGQWLKDQQLAAHSR